MIEELLKELDALRVDLTGDSEVNPEVVDDLMKRVRAVAPDCTQADIVRMNDAVQASEHALRVRHDRVGEELKRLKRSRTALQGYNHLRGFDQGQRLYRQA